MGHNLCEVSLSHGKWELRQSAARPDGSAADGRGGYTVPVAVLVHHGQPLRSAGSTSSRYSRMKPSQFGPMLETYTSS